jgi:hypothetical protein
MKQVLHIFRKDLRLYWIEILATLAMTGLFVWVYPMNWNPSATVNIWPWVPGTVTTLLPVSWMVMITRVIHAESLVGERQFWISRPYQWQQLLGAKALFLAAFLYVPFFVAQCLLLRKAGMHPLSHLPGLLYNLLLVTVIMVLPMACLAAVTNHFGKTLLTLLGLFLFAAGVAYLSSLTPTSSSIGTFGDEASFVVAMSVFLAVLFVLYARRSVMIAWTLLVGLAVTFSAIGLNGGDEFAMGLSYPLMAAETSPQLAFRHADPISSYDYTNDAGMREITIVFPVAMSGIAPNTAVNLDDARIRITSAKGEQWTSHWQSSYTTSWMPGDTNSTVSLKISRSFYNRMKDTPVTVEMSAAITVLKQGRVTRMTLGEKNLVLPGGVLCRTSRATFEWSTSVSCLSPMRQPPRMLIGTKFSTAQCSTTMPPLNDGDNAAVWVGSLDTQPADFGLTSVWGTSLYFQRFSSESQTRRQYLCLGAPLTILPYTVSSRMQQKIVSQPLLLKNLLPPVRTGTSTAIYDSP